MANEKPLKLDMPFEEALRRLAQTDPKELPENVRLRQPARPAGPDKKKAGRKDPDPPDG
jgi:hypothetical protein